MDILEIVSENIEAHDIQSVMKLVDHYVKEGKNKNMFSSFLVNLFCKHYISKNLWLLKEFSMHISNIERCGKKKDVLCIHLKDVCSLLTLAEHKTMNLYKKGNVYSNEKPRIDQILFSTHKEYETMVDLRDYLLYEPYSLLNTLYHCFAHCCDLPDCFIIIRYLLTCKKKEVIQDNHYQDIIDVMFLTLMKYIEGNRLPSDVKEFVVMCKDLFYYRCKQKDRVDRINLLFYAVFVLMHRKTKFQEIEYRSVDNRTSCVSGNVEYLYVLTKYDAEVGRIVRNDRELSKLYQKEKKTITVDDWGDSTDNSWNIIKLTT